MQNLRPFNGCKKPADHGAKQRVLCRITHEGSFRWIVKIDGIAAYQLVLDDHVLHAFTTEFAQSLPYTCFHLLPAKWKFHLCQNFRGISFMKKSVRRRDYRNGPS